MTTPTTAQARARELLALEYDRQGDDIDARCMRRPVGPDSKVEQAALRAITVALQSPTSQAAVVEQCAKVADNAAAEAERVGKLHPQDSQSCDRMFALADVAHAIAAAIRAISPVQADLTDQGKPLRGESVRDRMLLCMVEDQIAREGSESSFRVRAGLLRDLLVSPPATQSTQPAEPAPEKWEGPAYEYGVTWGRPTEPAPATDGEEVGGLREALKDVKTHRRSWREGLALTRDYACEGSEDPESDRLYWQHEIDAFDRTFEALAALTTPPASRGEGA